MQPVGERVIDDALPESILAEARRLEKAAERLRERPVDSVVRALGSVGERFLDQSDPLRVEALRRLPSDADVSPAMASVILDGMAGDWTRERLDRALRADFPDPGVLDRFCDVAGRRVHAVGPELTVQIVAGGVPGVGVNALLRALLVKSPTLLRPGRGDEVLAELFLRGLSEEAGWLVEAATAMRWRSEATGCTEAALRHARAITVYGSDATVSEIRSAAPVVARLIEYHHRISLVVIGREALESEVVRGVADEVARSVSLFEQRGCVCPHLVLVESGGAIDPEGFGAELASASARCAETWPALPSATSDVGALQQLRGVTEMQAAASGGRVWHGGASASWTVVYESEPREGPPTTARGVRVRPWSGLDALVRSIGPLGPHLQTVGLTGMGDRRAETALELARLGATRIVEPRDMGFPPPWWLHDGRRPLDELVRWAELE